MGSKPSRTLLTLQNFILFQRNLIRRFAFLRINQISIELCGGDILMRRHILSSVNICD